MDGCDSQMELTKQASLPRTAIPYFQLSPGHFHLTLLQTTCPDWAHHTFPITLHFPHRWPHLQVFRWPDQPLECPVFSISTFYLLFSTSCLDLYLYFYCHHSLPPDYISFDSLGLFPLTYGCELIFWNTTLSTFFLKFSSDPVCFMNQVQILYLGIPSLFIFSLVNVFYYFLDLLPTQCLISPICQLSLTSRQFLNQPTLYLIF